MRPIQMVDTKTQYQNIKKEVDAAVIGVLESSQFIGGKIVDDFSNALALYNESKYCIPCANGTDALQIAMMALDIKAGDEVITPSFTYIATVEVAALLGIKPIFIDVDAKTFCMDVTKVEAAITHKTKAIIPVHLYGHVVDMEPLMEIAKKYNLFVIEDNAQGIGANYIYKNGTKIKSGAIGDIGCTSFYPSKNLGGYGDGGAMFTNDEKIAAKLKMIASHGQSKRYYHDVVGCNSRLDAVQAAILNIKLKHLNNYIKSRVAVADFYDAAFLNNVHIQTPFRATYQEHVFHQYTIKLENINRDALQEFLASVSIPSMIYYPVAAHQQKMFDSFNIGKQNLPITDELTACVISLPIHTEFDEEQLIYITDKVNEFCK